MKKIPVLACSSVAILALGLSIALPSGFAQNVENTTNQSVQTISENTIHSETASSGPVTLKASWDETKLGSPTTFHVEATGGSDKYMFRMDAPSYSSPDEYAFESVADPSRSDWTKYTSETTSHDYEFTMMASGTYNFHFYVMDKTAGVYYLRVNFNIQVSDPNYPSISEIVSEAVAQSEKETDGTEYAKAVWLHDWLISRMEYDSTLKWSSAESALSRGLGTCQSYESAYSKLLTKAGIENVETRDTKDAHTWNAVKIDGDWYQIDATWDDSNDNWYGFDQRHLYFGLTDELMTIAHPGHESMYQTEGYAQRSTSLKDNYYVRSGEADQWADKYAERIQKHLDALDKTFTVDVDNANDPPSIRNIVNGIITYAIGQKNWNADGRDVALTVKVNDKVFEFTAQYADIPVESVSISGDGVSNGKLSLKSGASVQLTATVRPDNATDRKVTWTSSDSSVANVMGTGVVTAGSKAGKATVTATAGGVSASVEVTVEAVGKHPMTVWYHPDASWTTVKANWRLESDPKTLGRNVDMVEACGGWYRLTIPDTKGSRVAVTFTDMKRLDNNANRNYVASGSVMTVKDGVLTLKAPDLESKQPMTVWYHPDASWTTVKANWRLESDPKTLGRNVDMVEACGGWYRLTIPDTKGSRVAVTFTDMKRLDNNANRNYVVSGGSMAVSGGQVIGDVTPNCAITNKQ